MTDIDFRPIDPVGDRDLYLTFGRDLLTHNFGTPDVFTRHFGEDGAGYVDWMTARAADGPRFAEFVTAGEAVIGMIVLGTWKTDSSVGYVHHYYLVPAWRGRSLGGRLDDRAVETLSDAGYRRLRLSTMPANRAATALYRRHGWVEAGPREGGEGAVYFERVLDLPRPGV